MKILIKTITTAYILLLVLSVLNKPALAEGFRPELVQTGLPGLPNAKIFYTEFASNGVKNCGLSVINNYEVVASLQFKLSLDFSCMSEFSIWTQEGLQRQGIGKCLMDHALAKLDTNNPLCKSSTDYIFSPVRGRGVNYSILQSKISQTSNCPDSVYKALCETPTAKHLVRNGFEPLSCKELLTAYKVEFVPQPECGSVGPHSKVFYLNGAAHELKYPTGIYNSINPEDFVAETELNSAISRVIQMQSERRAVSFIARSSSGFLQKTAVNCTKPAVMLPAQALTGIVGNAYDCAGAQTGCADLFLSTGKGLSGGGLDTLVDYRNLWEYYDTWSRDYRHGYRSDKPPATFEKFRSVIREQRRNDPNTFNLMRWWSNFCK